MALDSAGTKRQINRSQKNATVFLLCRYWIGFSYLLYWNLPQFKPQAESSQSPITGALYIVNRSKQNLRTGSGQDCHDADAANEAGATPCRPCHHQTSIDHSPIMGCRLSVFRDYDVREIAFDALGVVAFDQRRIAESFFSSLKKERIKKRIYADRETAILDVSEYIEEFYNPIRRHSYLGGISPNEFEAAHRSRRLGVH